MIGSTDYVGIAAIITALGGAVAAVVAAVAAVRLHRPVVETRNAVQTNGDPRTLGEIASDVGAAVAPPRSEQLEHDPPA